MHQYGKKRVYHNNNSACPFIPTEISAPPTVHESPVIPLDHPVSVPPSEQIQSTPDENMQLDISQALPPDTQSHGVSQSQSHEADDVIQDTQRRSSRNKKPPGWLSDGTWVLDGE